MTTDAELRDRFEADLPSVLVNSTAPNHLTSLIALVLYGTPELDDVPAEERTRRIERLAADLAGEGNAR